MATGCEESASKKQKGHRLASPTATASNQGRPTEATAVTREGSWALMGVPLQSRASACPGHGALTHSSRGAALTQRPLEQPPYWSLLSAEAPPTPPQSPPHTAFSPTHTVKYFSKGVSIVPQEPSGLLLVSRCLALTPGMALTSPLIQALHFIVRQSET